MFGNGRAVGFPPLLSIVAIGFPSTGSVHAPFSFKSFIHCICISSSQWAMASAQVTSRPYVDLNQT
jgi:hypothetical protein